ncbi:MAG: hypothetical protein GX833_04320, partial [Clostridium sp.]|nr:hypothetical protein [Clostridium sp.]
MEEKNYRRQKRKELNKKNGRRTIKKVLIALMLVITIPAALGTGYVYYMANKIDSRHIDDPIWDTPLEDPVGTGEDSKLGEDLIASEEELNSEADGMYDDLIQEGYKLTEGSDTIPDFTPPKETDNLGIEKEVEDKLSNLSIVKNNKIKNILLLGIDSQNGVG